jgi:Phosphotransferase enzyme family
MVNSSFMPHTVLVRNSETVHENVARIDPAAMDEAVRLVAVRRGWCNNESALTRAYARMGAVGQSPFATAVYTVPGYRRPVAIVEAVGEAPARNSYDELAPLGWGWLGVNRFGSDPQLPTLKDVLARFPGAEVVRYRPGHRCTLRIGDNFVKVFPDNRGEAIDVDARALFNAYRNGELDFAVAEPRGWFPGTLTQWQGTVRGKPVLERLKSPEGPALARLLGSALASLTVSSVVPAQTTDIDWQQRRTTAYLDRLALALPSAAPMVDELRAELQVRHNRSPQGDLVALHGSPHPHQWLAEGNRVGLVDFDRLAWGDPELDVATFTTEVELENPQRMDHAAVNGEFIAGFESVFGALRPNVLTLYETHKRIALASTSAIAFKPNSAAKASTRLQRALTRLVTSEA